MGLIEERVIIIPDRLFEIVGCEIDCIEMVSVGGIWVENKDSYDVYRLVSGKEFVQGIWHERKD